MFEKHGHVPLEVEATFLFYHIETFLLLLNFFVMQECCLAIFNNVLDPLEVDLLKGKLFSLNVSQTDQLCDLGFDPLFDFGFSLLTRQTLKQEEKLQVQLLLHLLYEFFDLGGFLVLRVFFLLALLFVFAAKCDVTSDGHSSDTNTNRWQIILDCLHEF
jgi:hypothetical protein